MTGFAKPTLAVFNGKPGCYCIIFKSYNWRCFVQQVGESIIKYRNGVDHRFKTNNVFCAFQRLTVYKLRQMTKICVKPMGKGYFLQQDKKTFFLVNIRLNMILRVSTKARGSGRSCILYTVVQKIDKGKMRKKLKSKTLVLWISSAKMKQDHFTTKCGGNK